MEEACRASDLHDDEDELHVNCKLLRHFRDHQAISIFEADAVRKPIGRTRSGRHNVMPRVRLHRRCAYTAAILDAVVVRQALPVQQVWEAVFPSAG